VLGNRTGLASLCPLLCIPLTSTEGSALSADASLFMASERKDSTY
jgi:hypothetical protein